MAVATQGRQVIAKPLAEEHAGQNRIGLVCTYDLRARMPDPPQQPSGYEHFVLIVAIDFAFDADIGCRKP
jgi:hypothetical protein